MIAMVFVLVLLILTGLTLSAWRLLDHWADLKAMQALAVSQPAQPPTFTADMIAHLPEPARRYFLYTIETGTLLSSVASITMVGRFGMGNRDKPDYLDFTATQVLAMPAGFVWKMRARRGFQFERWSNANPEKQHRLQPFGGYLSEFRYFDGFRLPTHVEAGNHFATDQYFPFFVADVTAVEFPHD